MQIPRVPRVRDIKTKLSSAKLLGIVLKNSLQFKLRRSALPHYKATEFDTVIVDMDGTLYKSDANLEGLMLAFPDIGESGKSGGEEIYDSLIKKIASGEYSVEQAITEGNKFFIAKKLTRRDFYPVLDKVKSGIRLPLVVALKDIKKSGKTIVLATLSSRDFGEMLNAHFKLKFGFEFDLVLGTELEFDADERIVGVKSIVGTKDSEYEGIPIKSKLTAVKEGLTAKGIDFDAKKAVLITDSYGDIDLAKMLVTILLKPKHPTAAQRVSHRLKLADYILPDNRDLKQNLESIILGPEEK